LRPGIRGIPFEVRLNGRRAMKKLVVDVFVSDRTRDFS
jgi:hypothetical protein